jgi:cytochrome b involved in lipid metabolism
MRMGKIIASVLVVVAVIYVGTRLMKGDTPTEVADDVKQGIKTEVNDSLEKAGTVMKETTGSKDFPGYTVAQVSEHGNEASCWTIVRGQVYDVTPAIKTHPGGPDKILAMCGKDATEAFVGKHGGQPRQEMGLEKLQIGVLEK